MTHKRSKTEQSDRVRSVMKQAGYSSGGIADGGTYGADPGSPVSKAGKLTKAKERPGGEAEGSAASRRLDKLARGGRVKNPNTRINIVVNAGKAEEKPEDDEKAKLAAMLTGLATKPPAPPPQAPAGLGAMGPGGGGAAPPMPGMFKRGGRVRSYKDLTAGAGSGEGRRQKCEMERVDRVLGR